MTASPEILLLRRIAAFNEQAVEEARRFMLHARLSAIARDYACDLESPKVGLGFNLFALISERYHQENFHSDILRALLDPGEAHGEKDKYLRLFLEFIRGKGAAVELQNYAEARVVREEGRIDLLITGEGAHPKRAIIIESKINNAPDMPRQLPGYLEKVTAQGYVCDAIVYLRLSRHSTPETPGWTDEERAKVRKLLLVVVAHDGTETNLANGWLRDCEIASADNPDAQAILRQYRAVIRKLGGKAMNKEIMERFYNLVVEGETLKTALSVRAMLDDLVLYRVERIIDRFKDDLNPFHKIANHQDYDAYFTNLFWQGAHLGIDIVVEPQSYTFQFWNRNKDLDPLQERARSVLEKMGCLDQYTFSENGYVKRFTFPAQEEVLLDHITDFKKKLVEFLGAAVV